MITTTHEQAAYLAAAAHRAHTRLCDLLHHGEVTDRAEAQLDGILLQLAEAASPARLAELRQDLTTYRDTVPAATCSSSCPVCPQTDAFLPALEEDLVG